MTRIQAVWRSRVLKRNLSALVRIGKRTRAIRIQRAARVYLAKKELHKRKEAFLIRSELALLSSFHDLDKIGRRSGRLASSVQSISY